MASEEERVDTTVLSCLNSRGPQTARQIARNTGVEKLLVNRCLYRRLEEKKRVTRNASEPPVWTSTETPTPEKKEAATRLILCVDLGNVHDVLKNAEPYAKLGTLELRGYADKNFNGYGVTPKSPVQGVLVWQSTRQVKNAAETRMQWDISRLASSEKMIHFLVATKDAGFMLLEDLVAETGHKLTFVRDWTEVREYIE
jgi:hypothetical protein